MSIDILIIDDDESLGEMLCLHFTEQEFTCTHVPGVTAAKEILEEAKPRLILLDQHMPDGTGLSLLPYIQEKAPKTPVLMMTGKHDMELAVEAMKSGAMDYIHKPLDEEELNDAVEKAFASGTSKEDVKPTASEETRPKLIGHAKGMIGVAKGIAAAATSKATVLIEGETGTGKELVARAIHHHAKREGKFLAINCSALVETLLESELFGHEKGAFTGAHATKDGLFTLAKDGTLFLDEIGEMSLGLQAKVLRVLQEGTFKRVGGSEELFSNAQVLCATHRDLEKMVKEGTFREDLLYRLKIITIHLPPLRERMDDLKELTSHLLGRINKKLGKKTKGLSKEAMQKLSTHKFPGNVRELENILTRAVASAKGDVVDVSDLPALKEAPLSEEQAPAPLQTLEETEKEMVEKALEETGGNKSKACEILGISRPALDRKIKKYELR